MARGSGDHSSAPAADRVAGPPSIVDEATGDEPKREPESEKDPAAVALGRKGGLKGGAARAAKLSAKKRSEIAKRAARARWEKTA